MRQERRQHFSQDRNQPYTLVGDSVLSILTSIRNQRYFILITLSFSVKRSNWYYNDKLVLAVERKSDCIFTFRVNFFTKFFLLLENKHCVLLKNVKKVYINDPKIYFVIFVVNSLSINKSKIYRYHHRDTFKIRWYLSVSFTERPPILLNFVV